jgi:hypothetical protein
MTGHILKRLRELEPFYRSGAFVAQGDYWIRWITMGGMRVAIDDPTVDKPEKLNAYVITPHDGHTCYISLQDINCPQPQWDAFMSYLRGDSDA